MYREMPIQERNREKVRQIVTSQYLGFHWADCFEPLETFVECQRDLAAATAIMINIATIFGLRFEENVRDHPCRKITKNEFFLDRICFLSFANKDLNQGGRIYTLSEWRTSKLPLRRKDQDFRHLKSYNSDEMMSIDTLFDDLWNVVSQWNVEPRKRILS